VATGCGIVGDGTRLGVAVGVAVCVGTGADVDDGVSVPAVVGEISGAGLATVPVAVAVGEGWQRCTKIVKLRRLQPTRNNAELAANTSFPIRCRIQSRRVDGTWGAIAVVAAATNVPIPR
jgi:hypothetical protein